ncbi:hypothetical protein ACNRBH_17850 [Ralstonia pseudosolanacearum]|uniref:hypothetical protein n=1 Tax=Ralstonia pseudosolanacearum TaxID=1310165 RepID=UPI003AABACDD
MDKGTDLQELLVVPPRQASPELVELLQTIQSEPWPAALHRHALFRREKDLSGEIFRAVSWNPFKRELYVLSANSEVSLRGAGDWHTWRVDGDDRPLDGLIFLEEPVRVKPPSAAAKERMGWRESLVRAVLYVAFADPRGQKQLLLNDTVLQSCEALQFALRRVCELAGRSRTFQTELRRHLHRYFYFGGTVEAFYGRTDRRGGAGKGRAACDTNSVKPGPRNILEEHLQAEAEDGELGRRQAPVGSEDLQKFSAALSKWYVGERKSVTATYYHMCDEFYCGVDLLDIPRINPFRYHANRLIEEHKLERLRKGERLYQQHDAPRTGTATDLTGGVLEVLDVDGFEAKVYVRIGKGARAKKRRIWVILAVSRLSSAILGYALALNGEDENAYRRCLASVLLPKTGEGSRAEMLGVQETGGLLHGNFDQIYVDNGAGKAKRVLRSVVDEFRLATSIAPPARGDFKSIGESTNDQMEDYLCTLPSGYTRKTDELSKDMRREAVLSEGVEVDAFEFALLMAIHHHNATSDRVYKQTAAMFDVDGGITPKEIFEYTQKEYRHGDAARQWSPLEVFKKFGKWEPASCGRGRVRRNGLRYTCDELEFAYDEHKSAPGPSRSLSVDVMELSTPDAVLWRRTDGELFRLSVIEEDFRRLREGMSRFEWILRRWAQAGTQALNAHERGLSRVALEKAAAKRASSDTPTPTKNRAKSRVSVEQQKLLAQIENTQQSGAEGGSGTLAKLPANAYAMQDVHIIDDALLAASAGTEFLSVQVSLDVEPSDDEIDIEFERRLAQGA